jgi:hypothetical protein
MPEAFETRKMVDQADVLAECERFEGELAELRAAWDQYFLGIERRPPTERHDELKRHATRLRNLWVRQTAARFRVNQLIQKHVTYERLWHRTLQEIEAGTYRRDLHRAKRKQAADPAASAKRPGKEVPQVSAEEADALLSGAFGGLDAPKPQKGEAISEKRLRAVYDAYVTARQRCNEDTSKLSFEQVAQTLRRQVPELLKKHNARAVDFKVVIRDGKAVLRAVPKEG